MCDEQEFRAIFHIVLVETSTYIRTYYRDTEAGAGELLPECELSCKLYVGCTVPSVRLMAAEADVTLCLVCKRIYMSQLFSVDASPLKGFVHFVLKQSRLYVLFGMQFTLIGVGGEPMIVEAVVGLADSDWL